MPESLPMSAEAAAPLREAATPRPRPGTRQVRLAPETLRLYASDWGCFARFCAERRQVALPAPPELVLAFLARPGAGRAALARHLAAIDHRHLAAGLPAPGAQPSVRAGLRAMRRAAPARPRPAKPSAHQLRLAAKACPGDLAGRRDRAVLLLTAAGLGRAALVGLQAEALRVSERGLTVQSATMRLDIAREAQMDLCPVRAVEDWLLVSATRYGPVFRKVTCWGTVEPHALGTDAVRRIVVRRHG